MKPENGKRSAPSLRAIDFAIAFAFFVMLIPIPISMCRGTHLIDQLNYFADMLAVLAALYAGRTIFFPSAQDASDSAAVSMNNSGKTIEVANSPESDAAPAVEQKRAQSDVDPSNQEQKSDVEPHDETPQQVFYAMSTILGGFVLIKIAVFLGRRFVLPEVVLSTLLITAAITFASISFGRALKYKVRIGTRFTLSLAFGISSGILASLTLAYVL
ncbi:hypothetical protein [Massilia sp. BHUDP2]|uniref:hypothetical protein n=1 Tax=Massilia sp. BHUDP2 TaxID=3034505 RepID=UPI003906107F